jgi:hypothetical protein
MKAPANARLPADQGGFGLELDTDAIDRTHLNEVALDVAIEAAEDACHAGLDPQEELKRAVRGYLWAIEQLKECVSTKRR